jgi:hypothetical protein
VLTFVADFAELLACKFLATPTNAEGGTPAECVPERSVTAAARDSLFTDFTPPTSLLRVRMRRREAAVREEADAAARVPAAWRAVTAALCVAACIVALWLSWEACARSAAAAAARLPAFAARPLADAAACAALPSAYAMLLSFSTALLRAHSLPAAAAALHRASYLAAARATGVRVPLLCDTARLEARCCATLRGWARRALAADMRDAVCRKRVGARRAAAIMDALAVAAEPPAVGDDDASSDDASYVPMPGSAADAEAFLSLPCDNDDDGEGNGGGGNGAHAVGLAGVGALIEGALEGRDVSSYMQQALPPPLQASEEEEADVNDDVDASWQPTEQQRQQQRRHDAAPASGHDGASAAVKRARQKQQRRWRPAAAHEGLAEEHNDDDAAGAGSTSAPAPPPPTPAALRGRDGGGWRTVEALLSAKESGWQFVRRRGHVLFRRTVRVDAGVDAGGGATAVQTYVVPCTPSDARAGRNARAALQRLDRGVTPAVRA